MDVVLIPCGRELVAYSYSYPWEALRVEIECYGHGPPKNFGWLGHIAFGPTYNWPVCSLIFRKISKNWCKIWCHQMSDFKANMHQIRTALGSLQRSHRPVAVFKGPTSKEREGKGRGKELGGKR